MKKGLIIGLAVLMVLGLATMGMADTDFDMSFEADNPDIEVYVNSPSHLSCWTQTYQSGFILEGTGYAFGSIESHSGSPATLGGFYTASDGDFSSEFWAFGKDDRDSYHYGSEVFSLHTIDAKGVTDGSMYVEGYAFAGSGQQEWETSAGQIFNGDAESVDIVGYRSRYVRPSGGTWSYTHEAEFTATVMSSSPVSFFGSTDGSAYGHNTWAKQDQRGLGFHVSITGSGDIDSDLYTMGYSYTDVVVNPSEVFGETSTWEEYPGYYPD